MERVNGDSNLRLLDKDRCDLVVIGGGIHGAACARIAAASGISVQLFERGDFASETSSRSSKMAHGGLRYLELFDFEQVFEGIKARERLFEEAGNLVRPAQFLIPVPRGNLWFRLKLTIGLTLYDLFVRNKARKHRWIPCHELSFYGFDRDRSDLAGCFLYTDGIMNDTRLVLENILSAESLGARTYNYAEVTQIARDKDESAWNVTVRDLISGEERSVLTKTILNCAGPWVSNVCELASTTKVPEIRFSRGVHLLFPTPWKGPALFLPLEGKSRYYFVWPHPAGTLVGTTEREVREAELDPTPWKTEIEEIYERVSRDLANTPLANQMAHYCYAGVRTIPAGVRTQGDEAEGRSSKESARLSRKHLWLGESGMLSLAGGKYTTADWTGLEGVSLVCRELGLSAPSESAKHDRLPGCASDEELRRIEEKLLLSGYPTVAAARLVHRFGARAAGVLEMHEGNALLSGGLGNAHIDAITVGEVQLILKTEKVRCFEDLVRRRLEVELLPGHGLDIIEQIAEIYRVWAGISEESIQREVNHYRERMRTIDALLQQSRTS